MRIIAPTLTLPLLIALGACQPRWAGIDGNRIADSDLETARQACRIDEKLALLEAARAANGIEAAKASSNENRMLQLDDFEQRSYAVYREIDECMRDQGFIRPD